MTRSLVRSWLPVAGVLAASLVIPAAYADDPPPPPVGWTGAGQAGAVLARGNTDTTTENLKLDATDTLGDWKDIAHLAFLYGSTSGYTTAQRLEGLWQTNYNFTKKLFVFGSVVGENDKFDGFHYQVTFSTGIGDNFIDTANTKLTGTLGAGYQRLQTEVLTPVPGETGRYYRTLGPSASDGVVNAGLNYAQQLTKTTKITDILQILAGSQNTNVNNTLALAVSMTNTLALSVAYNVIYNTNPPAGTRPTEQLTTLNLVYSFNQPPKK